MDFTPPSNTNITSEVPRPMTVASADAGTPMTGMVALEVKKEAAPAPFFLPVVSSAPTTPLYTAPARARVRTQTHSQRPRGDEAVDVDVEKLLAEARQSLGPHSDSRSSWVLSDWASTEEDSGAQGAVEGECEALCPSFYRELQKVHPIEAADPARLMVRVFVRDFGMGMDAEELRAVVRSPRTLKRTQDLLLRLIDGESDRNQPRTPSSPSPSLEEGMNYAWDRMRAMRQDMEMQGARGLFALAMMEEHVRFHVVCHHELMDTSASFSNFDGFSEGTNAQQLEGTLTKLHALYGSALTAGLEPPCQAEFWAYRLLLPGVNPRQFLVQIPSALYDDPRVRLAVRVVLAQQSGHWGQLLALGVDPKTPPVLACMMAIHWKEARRQMLLNLCQAQMKGQPALTLADLAKVMRLNRAAEAARVCAAAQLPVLLLSTTGESGGGGSILEGTQLEEAARQAIRATDQGKDPSIEAYLAAGRFIPPKGWALDKQSWSQAKPIRCTSLSARIKERGVSALIRHGDGHIHGTVQLGTWELQRPTPTNTAQLPAMRNPF